MGFQIARNICGGKKRNPLRVKWNVTLQVETMLIGKVYLSEFGLADGRLRRPKLRRASTERTPQLSVIRGVNTCDIFIATTSEKQNKNMVKY